MGSGPNSEALGSPDVWHRPGSSNFGKRGKRRRHCGRKHRHPSQLPNRTLFFCLHHGRLDWLPHMFLHRLFNVRVHDPFDSASSLDYYLPLAAQLLLLFSWMDVVFVDVHGSTDDAVHF